MKKTKIIYWIVTVLFAAFMGMSAIPDALATKDATIFMNHLGYPPYFTPFIGIAKLLGVIAILIPGFPRIKEWAYAGFAFDLIGATYSVLCAGDSKGGWAFMLIPLLFLVLSYTFYHKKLRESSSGVVAGVA